jgi:hypothetical protein
MTPIFFDLREGQGIEIALRIGLRFRLRLGRLERVGIRCHDQQFFRSREYLSCIVEFMRDSVLSLGAFSVWKIPTFANFRLQDGANAYQYHGPRGPFERLQVQAEWPHFQSRISGRSSPCLSMWCLCSMSLSCINCFR